MTLSAVIERSREEREDWRYTSLDGLEGVGFVARKESLARGRSPLDSRFRGNDVTVEKSEQARIVFVDGVWDVGRSRLGDLPAGVFIDDVGGVYHLKLADQTCLVTVPVEVVFINTKQKQPTEAATKLRITLGANCRLTLIERHGAIEDGELFAHVVETEIELREQAKLVHGKIINGAANNVHLSNTKIHAEKGAYYDNFTLVCGGKLTRNEIDVTLAGEQSQCNLNGAMLLRGSEHADTTTKVKHAAAYGTSRQIYKSVVDGKSRGVFQGKIIVEKFAQKTDGYQLSKALLLSDQAEMDAKPELEIYADDVKCSHGCTIGDLDEQAMFYLQSRGIGKDESRALLIGAFVNEIVDEIRVAELREVVGGEVERWLRREVR